MEYSDFDKLKKIYTELIELICTAKESSTMDKKMDCFFKMFQIVRACLEFSPYTHFYTQVLIDIIVKTYNTKVFRKEYNREYKRIYGLHYNHSKIFKEKQFKEWSKRARQLRDKYNDKQIETFKTELNKLSSLYCK